MVVTVLVLVDVSVEVTILCERARGGGGGGQRVQSGDINFRCLYFKINEGRGWEREREKKNIRWKYRQVEQHHANLNILTKTTH